MVVVSEAFLQFVEKNAIQQSFKQAVHTSFLRYVNDSHSRFQSCQDANNFLEILKNQQDECIQYTMEMEDDKKQIGSLDVSIKKLRKWKI